MQANTERHQQSTQAEQIKEYADHLFQSLDALEATEGDWKIEVRPLLNIMKLDTNNRKWFTSRDEFTEHVLKIADKSRHVFASVNPRNGDKGTKESSPYVFHIVADLDFKNGYTQEDRDSQLDAFPRKPTLLVDSGGGYQVYWTLKSPLDRNKATNLMHRMSQHFDSDRIKDSSRILRVPGTWNVKNEYPEPRRANIVSYIPSYKYSPIEIGNCLPALEREDHTQNGHQSSGEKKVSEERNNYLTSKAGKLKNSGIEDEAIRAALEVENELVCDPPLPKEEIDNIINSSKGWEVRESLNPNSQSPNSKLGLTTKSTLNNGFNVILLSEQKYPGPQQWNVENMLPVGLPTTWYGFSGSNKTTLMIHLALTLLTPGVDNWMGFDVQKQKGVLYLDAEMTEETITRTAYGIARGMGLSKIPDGFHYLSVVGRGIEEIVDWAIPYCKENNIRLVQADSYGFMCGGAQEDQSVVTEFQAHLDRFKDSGIDLHITDHTPKPQRGDNPENAKIFGSVYKTNWIRSATLLVGKELEDNSKIITMRHKKSSVGGEHDTFHVKIQWGEKDPDGVAPTYISQADSTDILNIKVETGSDKILEALPNTLEEAMTCKEIADETGMTEKTVQNRIKELVDQKKVEKEGVRPGRYWIDTSSQTNYRDYGIWDLGENPDNQPEYSTTDPSDWIS